MASDVDLCNLALAYIGDEALVSSINPPDGSAQAGHCARFYPIALEQIIELHAWGFSTKRIALALNSYNPSSSWTYAYSAPSNAVNYLAIIDPATNDDYCDPQPFAVESDDTGNDIIYCNQENAVLRYSVSITDTSKFSPLFSEALVRLLASKLAGPVMKGDSGRAESKVQLGLFQAALEKAVESDSNQRKLKMLHTPVWMTR